MGLLLVEILASTQKSLSALVDELLEEVGPAFYERKDLRLKHPVSKKRMVAQLIDKRPDQIGGEGVKELQTLDGVKYLLADDSWLLIRPSGTEPVLRVYAEGRSEEMVRALLGFGEQVAGSVT